MSFLSTIWDKISHLFDDVEAAVVTGLSALLHSIAQNGGPLLISLATAAVAAAEAQGGSGSDKFAAAKASVLAGLEAQGVPIVLNAVHGAIEAAVADLLAQASAPVES